MVDVVDKVTRSRMMAGIHGKDTHPELVVRKGLHRRGFRYLLHYKALPGKPDLVFPKYRAILLINGCFWHGHDCHLFKWPSTREVFWRKKIMGTQARDCRNQELYRERGWRVLIIWECALKGRAKLPLCKVIDRCESWIQSDLPRLEIRGKV